MSRKTLAQIMGRKPRRRYEDVAYNWVDSKQLIGIEIEAEQLRGSGKNTVLPDTDSLDLFWSTHSDGSLRNGVEYVLSRPMCGSELATAIDVFFKSARLHRAITSGTHIHVDMMTEDSYGTAAQTLYLLVYVLEPGIFAVAEPGRQWCGFTNPLEEAPPHLICSIMEDSPEENSENFGRAFRYGRELKYYGLNFQPLATYGSVEFRYFPTATSQEELVGWVNFVQAIVKSAKQLDQKEALFEVIENRERYETFVRATFPEQAAIILDHVPHEIAVKRLNQAMLNFASAKVGQNIAYMEFDPSSARLPKYGRFFRGALSRIDEEQARYGSITAGNARVFVSTELSWGNFSQQLRNMIQTGEISAFTNGDIAVCRGVIAINWHGQWWGMTDYANLRYAYRTVSQLNSDIHATLRNHHALMQNVIHHVERALARSAGMISPTALQNTASDMRSRVSSATENMRRLYNEMLPTSNEMLPISDNQEEIN